MNNGLRLFSSCNNNFFKSIFVALNFFFIKYFVQKHFNILQFMVLPLFTYHQTIYYVYTVQWHIDNEIYQHQQKKHKCQE